MQTSSTVKVGCFTVQVTPGLRENFERIHKEMIEAEVQFSTTEQLKMFAMCTHGDERQQAGNLLELMHYLACQGVPITKMLSRIRCGTTPSYDGVAQRQLAVRIKKWGLAPFEATDSESMADSSAAESSMPLFLAPAAKEVAA